MAGEPNLGKPEKKRFWQWSNVIATLSTTVLALTALITVYLTLAAWKAQQESARPYFVLQESPLVELGEELSFELKFTNVGTHPAANLSSETVVFEESLAGRPLHHDEAAIVNEIPKDSSSSLVLTVPETAMNQGQYNMNPHYVVVDLHYVDPILDKAYKQLIYLKWNGVIEEEIQPTVHVRVAEEENISAYFQQNGIDL